MSIIVNGIELTEVIYAGVNLDIVKVKKGPAEAVTVFEKITQLATPQNISANGTVVSWDAVENATSYEIFADGTSIGTVEGAAANLISFTIDGTSYQAEEGMTWEQWVNSGYNTGSFTISDNNVWSGSYRIATKPSYFVEITATITNGASYILYQSGGSGN